MSSMECLLPAVFEMLPYIPLPQGFIYLVAVIDWYSRYVLSWELSNTLDRTFCLSALEKALTQNTPKIFNTDQGSQFTSPLFTSRLEAKKIAISQDGRGRALDNIFVERLWRSVKYEEVYPKAYASVTEAIQELEKYFHFYNNDRLHQSLNYPDSTVFYVMWLYPPIYRGFPASNRANYLTSKGSNAYYLVVPHWLDIENGRVRPFQIYHRK